jgi:anti-sigma factor RsiW
MVYRVTEELISAYIDGEVTADERAHVEAALADSAEFRQLYEELKGLRSDLQALPRFHLPDDFALRVLERAELASPAPPAARRHAGQASILRRRQNRLRVWRTVAATAATIAVGLLFALVYVAQQGGDGQPQLVEGPTPAPVIPPEPAPDPATDKPDIQLAEADFDRPKYVFIVDLTLTPQAQQDQVFRKAMRRAAIDFDTGIPVDEDLEASLLDSRFIGDVQKVVPGDGSQAAPDAIEMIYVSGNGNQINQAIADLQSRPPAEILHTRFDMAIEPKERDVFRRLNDAIRFAEQEPSTSPRARPLIFSFALRTAAGGFFAGMSSPVDPMESIPQARAAENKVQPFNAATSFPNAQPEQGATERITRVPMVDLNRDDKLTGESLIIFEVLFVLRNLQEAP